MPEVYDWLIGEIVSAPNEAAAESNLFDLDVRLNVAAVEDRPEVAEKLRAAVQRCKTTARAARLQQAADAIESGQWIARNPQGLTLSEAIGVNTVTIDEYAKLAPFWPTDQPASMPDVTPWEMFPGFTVRVAEEFKDFDGEVVPFGEVLVFHDLSHFPYDDGYTITFDKRVVRLSGNVERNVPMIQNVGNQFFEPVPTISALKKCFVSIQQHWRWIDLRMKWQAPMVRAELDACGRWLAKKRRDEPPVCVHWPLLASLFEERTVVGERLKFQIAFLFAGIVRFVDDETHPAE